MSAKKERRKGLVLACDGGATGLRAGLYDAAGTLFREMAAGPCNPIEHGIGHGRDMFLHLLRSCGNELPDLIAAAIAGAGRTEVRTALAWAVAEETGVRVRIADDLHPLLLANAENNSAVLAIAGTGSSVLAWDFNPYREIRIGGWGRVFGDEGSAYAVAVSALQAAARAIDGAGHPTRLAASLGRELGLDSFDGLVLFSAKARKHEIAALARIVDKLAAEGDAVAAQCIEEQALRLVEQTLAARKKLDLPSGAPVFISGGLFEGSARFREVYRHALSACCPQAEALFPPLRGHAAAFRMATLDGPLPAWITEAVAPESREDAMTERRLPAVRSIDTLSAREIVTLMTEEDAGIVPSVQKAAASLAEAVEIAAGAIRTGGRLIYVGAGTSGRLGVLDASECPATFGTHPEQVIAIIAGGERAIRESVEGAEDDTEQARADLAALQPPLHSDDVVVGITASGRTPYVRAALAEARQSGAHTVIVACNPVETDAADILVVIETGPEVVAGSTRLKAGTATKMVLNILSTGAMALNGRVYDGLMIGMRPVNVKLRKRAERIVAAIAPCRADRAKTYLAAADGNIAAAVLMARHGCDYSMAKETLARVQGNLRRALEHF